MMRGCSWSHWKNAMIDLSPDHLATVKSILAEHVPECEVRAFGSRATWTARDYSDLDLAIGGVGPLDWRTLGRLKETFEESNLPMRVDVLDWHAISESFRNAILRNYEIMQEGIASEDTAKLDAWRDVRLGDLCDFRSGSVFKLQYQGSPKGDYPFIKVSDMNHPANGVRIHESANWVSKVIANEIKAKPIPEGSVVFAKIGEALKRNRLRMVVQPTIADNNMMAAIPYRDIVDARFLFYGMHQFDFGEVSSGTALPYLTISTLAGLTTISPTSDGAASHCPCARDAGRQDRVEPADERDAGGDGAGPLQVVVRGL